MSALMSTMIILFAVIIVGYIAGKANFIDNESNKKFSTLMLYITSPFLIISSVTTSKPSDVPVNIFKVMAIGIVFYAILILFAKLYVKIIPLNEFELPVYEAAIIFGNTSFLGYPVFKALLGDSAIFVSTILNLPFNILLFSYGIYLFTKGSKKSKVTLKNLINPGFISAILALLIYLTGIKIPFLVSEIFSSVGGITIPLSMLLIGSSLSKVEIGYLLKDIKALIYCVIKLVILPVIIFFITKAIGLEPYLIKMITINIGFPSASMIVMLATQFNKSTRSASIVVFMSTLLSVATIPLIEKFLFALI